MTSLQPPEIYFQQQAGGSYLQGPQVTVYANIAEPSHLTIIDNMFMFTKYGGIRSKTNEPVKSGYTNSYKMIYTLNNVNLEKGNVIKATVIDMCGRVGRASITLH